MIIDLMSFGMSEQDFQDNGGVAIKIYDEFDDQYLYFGVDLMEEDLFSQFEDSL